MFDDNIRKYVAYRRLHLRGAGAHRYDRGADGRSCERCRAATPGYPVLNMTGQSCGYTCSNGPLGEACAGCSHLAPVPCNVDADCANPTLDRTVPVPKPCSHWQCVQIMER